MNTMTHRTASYSSVVLNPTHNYIPNGIPALPHELSGQPRNNLKNIDTVIKQHKGDEIVENRITQDPSNLAGNYCACSLDLYTQSFLVCLAGQNLMPGLSRRHGFIFLLS